MVEEKARNDELAYMQTQTKRLEEYLNNVYGDWLKINNLKFIKFKHKHAFYFLFDCPADEF